jgi:hypothetical protein
MRPLVLCVKAATTFDNSATLLAGGIPAEARLSADTANLTATAERVKPFVGLLILELRANDLEGSAITDKSF